MNSAYGDESGRQSWWQLLKYCSGTEADRRNQYRFVAWLIVWAVAFIAATRILRSDLDVAAPVTWLLATVPTAFGLVAVFAYLRFLRMADELLRRIQLEGLAFGFGASAVFAVGYQLLQTAGAPVLGVSDFVLVMMSGWVAGQFLSMWRYR